MQWSLLGLKITVKQIVFLFVDGGSNKIVRYQKVTSIIINHFNKYNLGAYQLIFDETIGIKHAVILSIHAWNYKM